MLPSVNVTPIYTNLASFALSGPMLVIVGPANDGPVDTPTVITQPNQAVDTFVGGPLVKWAAKAVASKRLPVLAVRASATAVSAFSAVTRSETHGTSAITVDAGSTTDINAVVVVWFTVGGTRGTPGIYYRVSTNGGLSFATAVALGTDVAIDVTLGGETLTLNLAAGTIVTDETATVTASVVAAGTYGTLNDDLYPLGANTATPSLKAATYPDDGYEIIVEFLTGGTLGTAGITYRYTTSNGRTDGSWSQSTALGTDLEIEIPGTGGATVTLGTAAQTIGAGAVLSWRCYAPNFNAGSVQTALAALFNNKQEWELVAFCGTVDAAMALTIDGIFASAFSTIVNGEKAWIANVRIPQDGESDATYYAAMQAISNAARSCYYGGVAYGDCKIVDALTGDLRKLPVALPVALELATVTPNVDIARVDRPGLGVLLADELGNPDCHDESVLPGPDDYGFITLRTQPEGIYVTNPRIFSPSGSSVSMFPHRFVWNLHTRVAKNFFRKRLSVDLFADVNGHISEADARDLEKGANAAENDALRTPGYISGQEISVARDDDLLNTNPPRLTVSGRLQTKIYPKIINYTTQIVANIAARNT